MNPLGKNIFIWAAIIIGALFLYNGLNNVNKTGNEVSYSQFLNLLENKQLQSVTMQGNNLIAEGEGGQEISTRAPNDPNLVEKMTSAGANIKVEADPNASPSIGSVLLSWFPFLLLIAVWIFFMRQQMGSGKGGAMSFGKSRATLLTENNAKVTFKDVAGVDEAKEELQEVVDYLKEPTRFSRLGGKIPKGVLLVGSPGTGKTLIARAVAGEADVPFYSISGSDFVEMFVGVGAARVRDLFEQGKKNAPCIIFIDEIDAVGRHRGAGFGGGNDEREQTLNQLLVEMDGFNANEGVILIAATNRPDVLDPALMRPGRFDRQVVVPLPDIAGRERILKVHMQNIPLGGDVDASILARGTPGFSGADLANLVNEAALMAARRDKRLVDMDDFESAKDKVMMGAERRSSVMTEDQKKTTAYHEAGHALVALKAEGPTDPLHKITIIPRGRALGVTMQLPEKDNYTYDDKYLENQIAILMGGRLAEEIIFDQLTTGASNDIERATDLARRMVCQFGMSSLGPLNYGHKGGEVFLGRDMASNNSVPLSEEMAATVDKEIRKIVERNYDRARKLLNDNLDDLHTLSLALLEFETLDRKQVDDLLAGKKITPAKGVRRKAKKKAESKKDKDGSSKAKSTTKKTTAKKTAAKKSTTKKTATKKSSKTTKKGE